MLPEIEKFRSKYPDYNDLDDTALATMLGEKYPDNYGDLVGKVRQQSQDKFAGDLPSKTREPGYVIDTERKQLLLNELNRRENIKSDKPGMLDYLMEIMSTNPTEAISGMLSGESMKEQTKLHDAMPVNDALIGGADAGLTVGNMLLTEGVAGIAGTAKAVTSGADEAGKTIEGIRGALEYEPKSESGKKVLDSVGKMMERPVEVIGGAVNKIADTAYEVGGPKVGPYLGAGVKTLAVAIPEMLQLGGTLFAKKLFLRKILNKAKVTDLIDNAGMLKKEISGATRSAGIPDEEVLKLLPREATEQTARAKLFEESGVRASKGEISRDYKQLSKEQRLFESSEDSSAEPFRQFKLKQSEDIKKKLDDSFGVGFSKEESGQLVQEALEGRKDMLWSEKQELYDLAATNIKEKGYKDVPIFIDDIKETLPDAKRLRDLNRSSDGKAGAVMDTLAEYGVIDATEDMIKRGIEPEILSIDNYSSLDQALNRLYKSDTSGAVSIITRPVQKALQKEVDEMGSAFEKAGLSKDVTDPLKGKPRRIKTKDPLAKEARKYKSAEEFVNNKLPDSEYVTVYHKTDSPIEDFGKKPIYSKENAGELFVSNRPTGQAEGYGKNTLELRVKKNKLEIDDEFPSGEEHYTIDTKEADKALKTKAQLTETWNKAQKGKTATRYKDPKGFAESKKEVQKEPVKDKPMMGFKDLKKDVIEPLQKAKETVRQLKTEFDPKSLTGKLIDTKKNSAVQVIEASKVYDKLSSRATPIEDVRKVVNSLSKSGKNGKKALASLQSTTILDLMEAGFKTQSKEVSGVPIFNSPKFKKRVEAIGQDKLDVIFRNNRESLRAIRNIDKIASDLIYPAGSVPKGSSTYMLDFFNKMGLTAVAGKMGGHLLMEVLKKIVEPVTSGVSARQAQKVSPQVVKIKSMVSEHYPGLFGALIGSKSLEKEKK